METRNITLTLDKAKEWYNSGNEALKEAALQAYTEDELKEFDFRSIKCFSSAVEAIYDGTVPRFIFDAQKNLIENCSRAAAASFRLNIIRKALNKGHKMDFTEGKVYYPHNPIILPGSTYNKDMYEVEVAKVKIKNNIFTLIGGDAKGCFNEGLSVCSWVSGSRIGYAEANVGFLGCATREIAQHFSKYFAGTIFEAKYGDLIDYEWVDF